MVKLKINAAALQAFHQSQQAQSQSQSQAPAPPSATTASAVPTTTGPRTPSSKPPKPRAPKSSKPKLPKPPKTTSTPAATPSAAAAANPTTTPAPRPKKKSTKSKVSSTANGSAAASPLPPSTMALPKIKIKSSALQQQQQQQQPPPPPPPPAMHPPPAERPPKPKLKLTASSIAAATAAAAGTPIPPPVAAPPLRTPTIKLKHTPKATVPRKRRHDPGNGYDSEASDREEDPAIEENFVLRMQPGADCDYLREVIERKELNVTSDVWMKFKEPRKAVVCVRGNLYAAVLVDLPCVIEANKTLDKKNIFKVADICQMLLVTQRINHEEEIWKLRVNYGDQQFPHGLTPPMQYARKRRFRKRISNRTIEAVEAEVDRLLADDDNSLSSTFTVLDVADLDRDDSASNAGGDDYALLGNDDYDDEQDAEGEVEVEFEYAAPHGGDGGGEDVEMDADTLANDIENALFDAIDEEGGKPAESETSDEDEEEEGPAPEPELDDAAKEALQQKEKLREEIQDLQEMIETKVSEYEKMGNAMLKARVGRVIQGFRNQLELKRGMLRQGMLAQMGG